MKSAWPWQPVTASSHYCLHLKAGRSHLLLRGSQRCPGTQAHGRPREGALAEGCWKEPGVLRTDEGAW